MARRRDPQTTPRVACKLSRQDSWRWQALTSTWWLQIVCSDQIGKVARMTSTSHQVMDCYPASYPPHPRLNSQYMLAAILCYRWSRAENNKFRQLQRCCTPIFLQPAHIWLRGVLCFFQQNGDYRCLGKIKEEHTHTHTEFNIALYVLGVGC